MVGLLKPILRRFGYHVYKSSDERIAAGLRFRGGPCSVNVTPQSELTARGVIEMIRDRGLRDLNILDLGCGSGAIGLLIFKELGGDGTVASVAFGDINIFNIRATEWAIRANGFGSLLGTRLRTYLTDALSGVPAQSQFDLIVSNPVHLDAEAGAGMDRSPVELGTYDPGWKFHRDFYAAADRYLSPRGEIWFLENGAYSKEPTLKPFPNANPRLGYVEHFPDRTDPACFWMISRLRRPEVRVAVPATDRAVAAAFGA